MSSPSSDPTIAITIAASHTDQATVDREQTYAWSEWAQILTSHARRENKMAGDGALGYTLARFRNEPCACGKQPEWKTGHDGQRYKSKGCPDLGHISGPHHGHRIVANVIEVTALGIDFDKDESGRTLTHETADRILTAFASKRIRATVATTHSHRDDEHHYRLCIALSRPVPAADWTRFLTAALAFVGIPAGCNADARHFWYYPSAPPDALVFAQKLAGEPLDVDAILAAAPEPKPATPRESPSDYPPTARRILDHARQFVEGEFGPHYSSKPEHAKQHGKSPSPDGHTRRICAYLAHDLALSVDEAMTVLGPLNAKSEPPWDEDLLRRMLESVPDWAKGDRGAERDLLEKQPPPTPPTEPRGPWTVEEFESHTYPNGKPRYVGFTGGGSPEQGDLLMYANGLRTAGVPDDVILNRPDARSLWALKADDYFREHPAQPPVAPPINAKPPDLASLAVAPPKILGMLARDVARRPRSPVQMLATGFDELDKMLGGGFATGQVTAIAGPPSLGKSAFVLDRSLLLASKRPILDVSLELTAPEVVDRLGANLLNEPWLDAVQGKVSRDQIITAVDQLEIHVIGCDDIFDDAEARKDPLCAIERKANAMCIAYGVAPIVVVDYVQIMARGADDGLRQRVSELSMRIRQLAQRLDTVVLAVFTIGRSSYTPKAVQGLRAANDPRGYLVTLKESGDIEYDAATVLFLDVDDEIIGAGVDARRTARIVVCRCRQGSEGFVGAGFYPATGRWVSDPTALIRMSSVGLDHRTQTADATKLDTNVRLLVQKVREGLAAAPQVLKTKSQWRDSGAVKDCREATDRALETGALVLRLMGRTESTFVKLRDIVVPKDWSEGEPDGRPVPPPSVNVAGVLGVKP